MSDILEDLFGKEEKHQASRKAITKTKSYRPKTHPEWLLSMIHSYCSQYSGGKRRKNAGMIIRQALTHIGMTEDELKKEIESWKGN